MLGHFTFKSKYVLYSLNISEGIFQSEFSTKFNLVLPLSVASIFASLSDHPVASNVLSSYHFYSLLFLSFNNIPTQDVTNPISLLVVMCIYFVLRFEFWVFWSMNRSMSHLIKKLCLSSCGTFCTPE